MRFSKQYEDYFEILRAYIFSVSHLTYYGLALRYVLYYTFVTVWVAYVNQLTSINLENETTDLLVAFVMVFWKKIVLCLLV